MRENNTALPDISLLPVMANFFQVTTDELLGVDITKANEKIKEYEAAIEKLSSEWKLVEAVELARKACAEFPGSNDLLFWLGNCLYMAQNVFRTRKENLTECMETYRKILETSHDTHSRLACFGWLARCAHDLGDDKKALEYTNELPFVGHTNSYIIGSLGLYKGDERISHTRRWIRTYFDAIRLFVENLANAEDTSLRPKDRIRLLDELLSMQKIVFGMNLGENYMYSVMYSYKKAELYCRLNDAQKALDNLKEAVTYAGLFEEYDENSTYSSEMLKQREVMPRSHWSQSAFADLYNELFEDGKDKYRLLHGNKRFDSICETVREKIISHKTIHSSDSGR